MSNHGTIRSPKDYPNSHRNPHSSRSSTREHVQGSYSQSRQQADTQNRSGYRNFRYPQGTNVDPRYMTLLKNIFLEGESVDRRAENAKQIVSELSSARQHVDTVQSRQECFQILEICLFHRAELRTIFTNKRPDCPLKLAVSQLILYLGCCTGRLDMIIGWQFEQLQRWPDKAPRSKEYKISLLKLLGKVIEEAVKDTNLKRFLQDLSPNIINGMVIFLDSMDSADYLVEVVRLFNLLAKHCTAAFSARFQDIIDLLVGWHVETGINISYDQYRFYWNTRLPLAFELLHHFLNDMCEIIDAIANGAPKSKWRVCENLFSCYHAIIRAVIPLIEEPEAQIDKQAVNPLFDRLRPATLEILQKIKLNNSDTNWLRKASDVLLLLFSVRVQDAVNFQWSIYQYICSQISPDEIVDISICQAILVKFVKLVDAWQSCLDTNILRDLLNIDSSPLYQMRAGFRDNKRLNSGILALLRMLLRLSRPYEELQLEITGCMERHLNASLNILIRVYGQNQETSLHRIQHLTMKNLKNDEEETVDVTPVQATMDTLFYAYILLDAASAWSNSQFRHLLLVCRVLQISLRSNCGDLFSSTFELLADYCEIPPCCLDRTDSLFIVAELIQDIFDKWLYMKVQTRQRVCILLDKLESTAASMQNREQYAVSLIKSMTLACLKATGLERFERLKKDMVNIILNYCRDFGSASIVSDVLPYVWQCMDDPRDDRRHLGLKLLSGLNPFVMADSFVSFDDLKDDSMQAILMATANTGSFRPPHFEIVMKNLGLASLLLSANNAKLDRTDTGSAFASIKKLFYRCNSLSLMQSIPAYADKKRALVEDAIKTMIDNSASFFTYWAMWESARYCILSRLRTPFGGPQQTLAAFERHLTASISSPDKISSQTEKLLMLLDRLELQMYNAYEGCATNAMPSVPRSSLAFFRTNKKTCKDYFAKIRPMIIQCAKRLGEYHLLIRNTMEYLKETESGIHEEMDVKAWLSNTQTYIRDLVEVAIMLKESDLIYGVQAWYKRVLRRIGHVIPSFHEEYVFLAMLGPFDRDSGIVTAQSSTPSWFSISAMFASGHYEEAIKALRKLHDVLSHDEYGIIYMLDKQATDYYCSLEDYKSLVEMNDISVSIFGQSTVNIITKFYHYPSDYSPTDWNILEEELASKPEDISRQLRHLNRLGLKFGKRYSNDAWNLQLPKQQSAIIDLQLQHCQKMDLTKVAMDWEVNSTSAQVHLNMHTKEWAQLICASKDRLAVMQLAAMYLHGAKIARKQRNLSAAEAWLECAKSLGYRSQAEYESIKLQLATTNHTQLESIAKLRTMLGGMTQDNKMFSRGYLLAAKLIKNTNPADISKLQDSLETSMWQSKDEILSSVDAMMESMLAKATQGQMNGKAWYELGTYHYKRAWRILDNLGREEGNATIAAWTRSEILSVLQTGDLNLYKDLCKLLKQYMGTTSLDVYQDAVFVETVRRTLASFDEDVINRILEILNTAHHTVVNHFRASVDAFFRYMILNEKMKRSASPTMTVALRLLRVLVKYGMLTQANFTEHIDTVPVEPWMQIIPQLFARLNHAPEFAQKIIVRLMERISDKYPRHIIYDVIVGSTCSRNDRDAKNALIGIANRMKDYDNQLWISTHRMAEELEKITVLWEEQWTYQIASLTFSVMEMFSKLDSEAMRLEQIHGEDADQINKSFLENYDGVVKFAVLSLQKLMDTTIHTQNSMTPHEQWFTSTFGSRIEEAFELLLHPQSLATYREGWEMFMSINRDLAIETHKMRILELKNVSPYLESMQDTIIGVPGINDSPPMIKSFGNNVVVLPTKTKPKKLDLMGTDGRKHSYLFKGLEDLHLDERIMQLLTTANSLLAEDRATASRKLRSRTYAVIPLSDHSGMIQWINDATPLFALYKRWQRREQAAQILLTNDKSAPEPPILRPTEIFMRKIEAALKAEGRRVTANRRHWPRHILKNVFLELLKETPGDLLAKEIWCNSVDAVDWMKKSTTLSRSLAVMSIIGYIIGLGDRHLDNMMVDFATGEIIHIDYNVCFEKGRKLRVPELVPYRLTQNLFHALGVFGVDGVFRTAAEETLRVLRKHKEVLMTLLDAFVYDPLVHWNNEAGDMETRQILELQANLGLIAARLGDQKNTYESQRQTISDLLDSSIRSLKEVVARNAMEDEDSDEEDMENPVQAAQQQLSAIIDECRLWHGKHINAINALNEGGLHGKLQRDTTMSSDLLNFVSQQLRDVSGKFPAMLASWLQQKTLLYQECIADLERYRQLIRPVSSAILLQNTCKIWQRLEQLSNNGYQDGEVQEMCQTLIENFVSPVLQSVEHNATNFAQRISRSLATMESCLKRPSSSPSYDQCRSSIDLASIPRSKIDYSLKLLENAFQRYNTEANGNEYFRIPENIQILETQCNLGLHGRALDMSSTFTLVTSLEEHITTFKVHCDDKEAFDLIFACAKSAYSFNDALLDSCKLLSDLIQRSEASGKAILDSLLQTLESVGDGEMLDALRTKNINLDVYWTQVQSAFAAFDSLLRVCHIRNIRDMDDVATVYIKIKRQILALMVQEIAKYLHQVPSHAWIPSQVTAWSLSSIITAHPKVKDLLRLVTNDLLIPFTISAIEDLYQVESSSSSLENDEESINPLLQLCFSKAEARLREQASFYISKYRDALNAFSRDLEHFQWFNAPYLQKQWPLIPSKLLVRLSDAPDRLQHSAQILQELDLQFVQVVKQAQMPVREELKEIWTRAYREELEKCMETMDIFNTFNHMESCRIGFTQATILYEDVLETLRVFTANQETSQTHDNDGATMMVPKTSIDDVREKLVPVTSLLSTLKSPIDGVVSLLESIIVPDIDTDNELKPAQRSAQVILDQISFIQKEVAKINGETNNNRSKGDTKTEWTFAELISSVQSISNAVGELFSAIRNLEESTSTEKLAEEKDSTLKQGDQPPNSEVQLIGDVENGSDHYVNDTDSPSLEDVKRDEGPAAATTSTNLKRNAEVMAIMQRIRAKLEGRDFGAQQSLGVSEQVAKTIEQAMSVENLSALYEGWTSWV